MLTDKYYWEYKSVPRRKKTKKKNIIMFLVAPAAVKAPIQIAASFTSRFSPLSFSKSRSCLNNTLYNTSSTHFTGASHLSVTTTPLRRESRCFAAMATTDDTTMDAVQRRLMFDDE